VKEQHLDIDRVTATVIPDLIRDPGLQSSTLTALDAGSGPA